MTALTVSQLAERAGISADTVRYYERIGLLPAPPRSRAGYRLYAADAAERVRFIKRSQRLGLRLDAIAELLEIRDRGQCPCGHTRRLLEARLVELDAELAALAGLRSDIGRMVDDLPSRGTAPRDAGSWPCDDTLVVLTDKRTREGDRP